MSEDKYIGTGTDIERNNTYFQYQSELKEEFLKIFNLETQEFIDEMFDQINYFLEFIDEDSELGQYSVNNIGRRAKIIQIIMKVLIVFLNLKFQIQLIYKLEIKILLNKEVFL